MIKVKIKAKLKALCDDFYDIDTSKVMKWMFYECKSFNRNIANFMFMGCSSLRKDLNYKMINMRINL